MYNVAIIGVGGIGKRHLESVLKSSMELQIYIIDNNQETVDTMLAAYGKRVIGGGDVSILPLIIDVAIIATSSMVRKMVFEQLISHSTVKNIIFEKVLFQRREDYFEVERLLKKEGIRAWVNCARREYNDYKSIKKFLDQKDCFTFHIVGGDWGLGCNGIHMLDLIQFLSDSSECIIDELNLLPLVKESKRPGYKEIYGTILGHCGKCQGFSITCYKDSNMPSSIELSGSDFHYTIMEGAQKMLYMCQENDWRVEERKISILYQSQLTQSVVENILNFGSCNLPKYDESMQLHLVYLEPLIKFFEEQGMEKGLCPIT